MDAAEELIASARKVSPDDARKLHVTLSAFNDLSEVQRKAVLALLQARTSEGARQEKRA